MAAFRTKVMQTHCPDAISSHGGNSFLPAYYQHHSPGASLHITDLDYPITPEPMPNSVDAEIHSLLQSRCVASAVRVWAIIIVIQTEDTLQRWFLWATREHHVLCPYLAWCLRHEYDNGTNRRGIWQASRWYHNCAALCKVWSLNEEIGILVKESAAGTRQ